MVVEASKAHQASYGDGSGLREQRPLLLENGDRLTRPEFERRYEAMPRAKKAELIEGAVHMPSPVRVPQHARPHAILNTWLGTYWAATPGVELCDNATVRLDLDNEPQPDALLRFTTAGTSTIDEDGYLEGAPELVAEVAASSASIDLHSKKEAYRRNGVQEYLVWAVLEATVSWFVLRDGRYELLAADDQGVIRSQVYPGLWLDAAALVAEDLAKVLACLQQGLSSEEHSMFRQRIPGSVEG